VACCRKQARASYYTAYTRFLATWGYAVVQYDAPMLRIVEDSTEVAPLFTRNDRYASSCGLELTVCLLAARLHGPRA